MDVGPLSDFYADWDKANPFLAPAREKMHAELKRMYERNGMIQHATAQEAVTHAIAQADKGVEQHLILRGSYDEIVTIPPRNEEKTLLAKPHPEGCTCPKCPQAPPSPAGVHLLPQGKIRIGDTVKDGYLDRIREAFADGCISENEFGGRQTAIMAASMKDELDFLTRDLPAVKKKEVQAPVPVVTPEPLPPSVFMWLLNLSMILFPVLGGIGVLFGSSLAASAALALAGGVAALLLTVLGGTRR